MDKSTVQERKIILSANDENVFDVATILNVSKFVPEGEGLHFDKRLTGQSDEIWVGPLTYFAISHGGQWPLESRYTPGRIELERDRRRHPRKKDDK